MLLLAACGGGRSATTPDDNGADARSSESAQPTPSEDGGADAGPDSEKEPEKQEGSAKSGERSTESVEVIDTAFAPKAITVTAGTEVLWKQTGLQPHSVTSSEEEFDSSPRCSPLRSDDCLGEGDGFSFVFDEPGTYSYYCRVHGLPDGMGMTGVVEVTK